MRELSQPPQWTPTRSLRRIRTMRSSSSPRATPLLTCGDPCSLRGGGWGLAPVRDEAALDCRGGRFELGVDPELFQQVLDMCPHRACTDCQALRNRLVVEPSDDERQNFAFTPRQLAEQLLALSIAPFTVELL